ncbi:putative bifunctional diguanylate cyclase/phosphodiesterase [Paraurantiacibacter namhicola]|uniref:Phytochrome-like protein cph2 n=1 Tax=Paraurantiacibacter namhicola TaxID=645517 RepID=A0A1C7D840_9SPHN|nr:EAL domain-containing protein [Paraurantiacibacter namhicola]ANU07656.1 Phytochrome-like protein cph2 [Paraurantiacibacter namhicola]
MQGYFGGDERDANVRRKLVETLYTQPLSLAVGALAGVACCTTAIVLTGNTAITIVGLTLIFVALARILMALWLAKDTQSHSAKMMEMAYEIGAFAYAFLSGLAAAVTMIYAMSDHLIALMITYAMVYGVGITARNAGRPFIALGQMFLSFAPVVVAGLIVGGPSFYVLSGLILFIFTGMSSITFNVFNTLKDQFIAAENSARMAEKMRELARTDVVTGLTNRAGLNHELVEHLMALPADRQLALFWLDLDRFKEVNDMLGHPVGDQVLAEVAQRLRVSAPQHATVSRFGGDEFVIACEVGDRGESERIAQSFAEALGQPYSVEGHRIDAGASMGVALLPEDGADIDSLMQGADLALYHAKVAGRDRIRFFDSSMTRELVRKKEIEKELRAAIQKDELSIFFQPIVDLKTGRIRTFEALVRWFHPEKGELRPDEFIPVAEETGVIITLGNWITAQAAKACAQWPEDVTIAVNLSPLQIRAPGAALGIMAAVRDAGLDPHRLELEVTESLFLDDDENTARFMEELAAEGVRFALDDFGTGYSSLGYINQFPFSKIKVDRSFVSGPNVGKKSDAIIRAVAEMGSTLEMEIVAEGLETVEQVKVVSDAGCTLGQGYYFSRAVPDFLAAMLLAQDRGRDGEVRAAG